MAVNNGIDVLSWTYNDPVVWHEFVLETAKLGRKHGLKNLYKSALYIEEKPLAELIEVIDIFRFTRIIPVIFARLATALVPLETLRLRRALLRQMRLTLSLLQGHPTKCKDGDARGTSEGGENCAYQQSDNRHAARHPAKEDA